MTLESAQKLFGQAIVTGNNTAPSQNLKTLFDQYSEEELTARLSIYANNFYSSLIDTLGSTFPTVKGVVGEEFFNACAKSFIKTHPPQQPTLTIYGESFPLFLSEFEHSKTLEYLADIARLDWLRHQCYYTEEQTSVPPQDIAKLDINQLLNARIQFIAASYLLSSPYRIHTIWELNNEQSSLKDTIEAEGHEHVMVIRSNYDIQTYLLDGDLYHFLYMLTQQHTIESSLEQVLEKNSEFDASSAIAFMIQSGLIHKIIN